MKKIHSSQSGQFLLEVIIAVGVVVLISTGLITATTASLRANQKTTKRAEAAKYLQGAMDALRQRKETDWPGLIGLAGTGSPNMYCFGGSDHYQLLSNCPTTRPNLRDFTRTIALVTDGTKIDANVTVSWTEGPKTYTSRLDSVFYPWQAPPIVPDTPAPSVLCTPYANSIECNATCGQSCPGGFDGGQCTTTGCACIPC